ncbi:MAG: SRPBCC family protein [Solirubrobacterales bacterium]|nr:SRPBCC family protein [Solirubrobacterales bacterium]
MSVVVAQIDIEAPPEQVWEYVMDPARTLEWVTIARRVGHIDAGPLREGFRMDQTLCMRGVNFKVRWTLHEFDIPHFARWEGRGPARSKAVIENRLTALNGGTHFDYRNEFKSPFGPLGAAASKALVGGVPDKEANASLRRLKEILEGE